MTGGDRDKIAACTILFGIVTAKPVLRDLEVNQDQSKPQRSNWPNRYRDSATFELGGHFAS